MQGDRNPNIVCRRCYLPFEAARLVRHFALGGAACIGLLAGESQAQSTTSSPAASSQMELEEVVVTARRVEERNQDVPISITSFSTTRLEQQNITQDQDLQALVPSLVVGQNGQGVRDASTFTLRGQGATFEGSPGVVTYLNEVPLPAPITLSNQGGPGTFLDLANVQVLAGPQGTLFGRNTTGGAVLLVPNKPTNNMEGYIQGTLGNYDDHELQGVANLPVIPDVLKVRLAAEYKDRGGFTHDVNLNVDHDSVQYLTMRVGIEFTPIDELDNYTMAYYTTSRNHGPGSINEGFNMPSLIGTNAFLWGVTGGTLGCNPAGGAGNPLSCASATTYYSNLAAQAKNLGPRADALDLNEFDTIRTWGVTNTTRYEITPDIAVRNIASYSSYKGGYAIDVDGTPAPQYNTGVGGISTQTPRDYFQTVTEELQLQGAALNNNLRYTVGGFYFLQEPRGTQAGAAIDYCFWNLIVFHACNAVISTSHFSETSKSEAAYAQGTFDFGALTPMLQDLKLTLGYRYTWDQIDGSTVYFGAFSGHLRSSSPTWTAGLDYKLTEGLLVYAKASRGYKAGGFNTYSVFPNTRTFGPEYDTTYEVGLKSDSHIADRPVRVNLDLYRTDYSKIQRAAGDFNPANQANGAVMLSTASAIIQGVELEADVKLTPDLEFGLNYGYTDAHYTKFPYSTNVSYSGYTDCDGRPWLAGGSLNLACRPLQYIAPNIFSAHLQYDLPLDPSLGKVTAFLNYSYEDRQHTEALFGTQQPFELLGSYSLVNLSLTWQDVLGGPIDASVFITNLTDALYRTTNTDTWQSLAAASTLYGEPRMFGFRLKYHWGS